MALTLRKRSLTRILGVVAGLFVIRFFWAPSKSSNEVPEITQHGVLDLVSLGGNALDVQRHDFLQARIGRDERPDIMDDFVRNGIKDYWERFQKPYIQGSSTTHQDAQSVLTSIEQLLSLNGWVAALCPTLTRPFGQNRASDAYDALIEANHLYFIPIVIHSADHFLVDQLAVIVQLAKTLGTHNLFVSMLDYASTDSTETLVDLCEAVLILLGVPFRIRRVPAMTEDPLAAYYPAEEAHMRNLALEPLLELYQKRKLRFHRVIWLKGFTCPNDILETIKVSLVNEAAMVCGMDWSEHNGFYIFSDRWRTRDILGDQFRQAKSSSKPDAGPPRDPVGAERYAKHLPFQVFCCESGTHVVDPAQSYYAGIGYRHGSDFYNATADAGVSAPPEREQDAPCLDSTQAWFCRDMWAHKASEGLRHAAPAPARRRAKRAAAPALVARQVDDEDQDVGADYDAMPENANMPEPAPLSDEELGASEPGYVPNVDFEPARILVNPRCVTTYAGVSHTQLALDLFGQDIRDEPQEGGASVTQYRLDSWQGAPESFVCQEQKTTGGRKATKTQRRLEFLLHDELNVPLDL